MVTDVRYRMSLPIIRSLGKKKTYIIAADRESTPKNASLGFYSKYTSARIHLPPPDEEEAFLSALEASSGEERQVIIPVGMDTLTVLCRHRDRVAKHFDAALPPIGSLELANDKYALMKRAEEVSVPHPTTTVIGEDESFEELAARVSYPAVIKYRAGELLHLDPKDRYCIVKAPEELVSRYAEMHKRQSNPLVQEYVQGEGFGVSVVMDKYHNPMALFCHRRLHEYPISGGPSCLCESAWDSELAEYAVKLLRSLNWVGVAMVEFKGTKESGYKLMEINPRLWGSSALAPISGCDIGSAIVRAAIGERAEVKELSPEYKVGRRMRFFIQDILAFFGYCKKEKKISFAIKYMASFLDVRTKDGVFSLSDPKPGLKYLATALKKKDKIIR